MKTTVIILIAIVFCASCALSQTISGVVNIYTPVLEIHSSTCQPFIVVLDSKGFNVGDKVLIIQMQGALLNLTNTAEYGVINDYANSGNIEFARISGISQNTIFLQKHLLKDYTISGKVQLVRVPEYDNVSVKDSVICPAWNGTVGGIIVLDAKGTITLNGNISARGKGFRGGAPKNSISVPSYHVTDYKGPISQPHFYARKGEGIGGELDGELMGRGAPANGGGGGNNHNGGGGGGANGGCGGNGGYGWEPLYSGDNKLSQGLGGKQLYSNGKIWLGGGGGAGHTNENDPSYGGNGGGIIIILANRIIGNNSIISSQGTNAPNAALDGAGGGGAGGTVVLLTNFYENLEINCNGGKGGDNTWPSGSPIASGGGGGGGTILLKYDDIPSSITIQTTGGISGVSRSSNSKFGSSDGCNGKVLFDGYIDENTSAGQPSPTSTTIIYRSVTAITPDKLQITTGLGAEEFCHGNKLLIIQMRGAEVQSSASDTYGKITTYSDAGNYEYCRIRSIAGNVITLEKPLTRSYTPTGKVQIVRVPEFRNFTLSDTLFCPKWNDTVFGVVALSVSDTLHLRRPIIADRSGFSGGRSVNASATLPTHLDNYHGQEDSSRYAIKGDGIANYLDIDHRSGRGAAANAGGGGNNHNAGGGGGANGGCGGKGGFGWDEMKAGSKELAQGLGGYAMDNTGNKIFMGGGGGGGHSNEQTGTNGGNGGGIVIIDAKVIAVEGGSISANGGSANNAPFDGAGGGGAGGTIILKTGAILGELHLDANGGRGGGVTVHRDGPGGGGGGGVVGFTLPAKLVGALVSTKGGYGGKNRNIEDYGQTDGCDGVIQTNVEIPGDNTILSVLHPHNAEYHYVTAFPIPAASILVVNVGMQFSATSCNLFDWIGKNAAVGYSAGNGSWNIDVSNLQPGVYSARLTSPSECHTVRVIVSR